MDAQGWMCLGETEGLEESDALRSDALTPTHGIGSRVQRGFAPLFDLKSL